MNEKLTYPPETYCHLILTLYEQLNDSESMEPVVEHKGRSYDARIWCSRGDVLEKAAVMLMQMRTNGADERRFIRSCGAIIHPNNPRVPGFVLAIGQEYAEPSGQCRIFCLLDLWRMMRRPNAKAIDQFRQTVEAACRDHEWSYSQLYRSLHALHLFGDNGCQAGIFYSDFDEADIPFIDQLVQAAVSEFRRIIESYQSSQPNVQDFQERNEIRREFLAWALGQDLPHHRAVSAGVPWTVFEAFAFPPEVHY